MLDTAEILSSSPPTPQIPYTSMAPRSTQPPPTARTHGTHVLAAPPVARPSVCAIGSAFIRALARWNIFAEKTQLATGETGGHGQVGMVAERRGPGRNPAETQKGVAEMDERSPDASKHSTGQARW